jgi:hypothetical protein
MKFFHPKKIWRKSKSALSDFFWYYVVPDTWEIRRVFKKRLGYKCDLMHPRTFNEKIQWLKLHDRKELYPKLVDKHEAKHVIGNLIGNEYIIPTLGVWNRFDDIDFSKLPNQFVLKCTHDSASVVLCKDKSSFQTSVAREKLTKALKTDYYHYIGKQWAYKGIERKIIAEAYLDEGNDLGLTDYKFMVFGGKCKCIFVCVGRQSKLRLDAYDMDWQLMPFTRNNHPNMKERIPRPKGYETMLFIAEKVAGFVDNPFVRVDFYEVNGKVYFGEVTFYPEGGLGSFNPTEWDYVLGDWIELEKAKQ